MKFKASKVEVEPILKGKDGRIYRPDIVVTGHGPDGEVEIVVIEAKGAGGPNAARRAREQALTYAEIIRDNRNRVAHGMGPLVDTDWFKDKMAEARVSLRQLAPKMGMEPSSLSIGNGTSPRWTVSSSSRASWPARRPWSGLNSDSFIVLCSSTPNLIRSGRTGGPSDSRG